MGCIRGVSLRSRLGRGRGRRGFVRRLGGFISFCSTEGGSVMRMFFGLFDGRIVMIWVFWLN